MEMVVMFECAQNFFYYFSSYYLKMEENSEGESYFFKYRHTYDVVDYMKQLVRDKKEKDLYLTVAIFHDLGRFRQKEKYQAYNDYQTKFDHAEESVFVLKENNWFLKNHVSLKEEQMLCFAISSHNKYQVEPGSKEEVELAGALRDADKLAVLKRPCYISNPIGEVSDEVYEMILQHKLVPHALIKTNADYALTEIAYIFDLVLPRSFEILREDNHLDLRFDLLKGSKRYEDIKCVINDYLSSH